MRLRRDCGGRHDLGRAMFVQMQLRGGTADGQIRQEVRAARCGGSAQALDISAARVRPLEAMLRGRTQAFAGGQQMPQRRDSLKQAYKVLGVESSASDPEVKKAYRRLMNQHHPDKLVANGLPESMQSAAQERKPARYAAYELSSKRA